MACVSATGVDVSADGNGSTFRHILWVIYLKCSIQATQKKKLGGGNSNIFGIFTPNFGEDESIWTIIFFNGVGSTTN